MAAVVHGPSNGARRGRIEFVEPEHRERDDGEDRHYLQVLGQEWQANLAEAHECHQRLSQHPRGRRRRRRRLGPLAFPEEVSPHRAQTKEIMPT